jgi:hypothetical protein
MERYLYAALTLVITIIGLLVVPCLFLPLPVPVGIVAQHVSMLRSPTSILDMSSRKQHERQESRTMIPDHAELYAQEMRENAGGNSAYEALPGMLSNSACPLSCRAPHERGWAKNPFSATLHGLVWCTVMTIPVWRRPPITPLPGAATPATLLEQQG